MIYTLIAGLIGVGMFFICADLFRIPYMRTSKAAVNLIKRQSKRTGRFELWQAGVVRWLAGKIKLNEYRRMQLVSDLQTAGINSTPELHISNAVVKAGFCGLFAIPAFYIFPIMTPLIISLSTAIYFKESKGIEEGINKKRSAIEQELPHLVFTIEKALLHSRDVLTILDQYRDTAGPELQHELNILLR